MAQSFSCRPGCAACCIAPSISSAIPGMPQGKPAGQACAALGPDGLCTLFGSPLRPRVCSSLQASEEMCGTTREEAMAYLSQLEELTKP